MPSYKKLKQVPRRTMHVFYIIETSNLLDDKLVSLLNEFMNDTIKSLREIEERNADSEIKLAILEYNSDCNWVTPVAPIKPIDLVWKNLTSCGKNNLGKALSELNIKLSDDNFMDCPCGAYQPVIIFLVSGNSADNYEQPLEEIRKNEWYKNAKKFMYYLSDHPNMSIIKEVCMSVQESIQIGKN